MTNWTLFRKEFLRVVSMMKQLGLKLDEILSGEVFPALESPYESPLSKKFILAVKLLDYGVVENLLLEDKYLVFQYDYVILQFSLISYQDLKNCTSLGS